MKARLYTLLLILASITMSVSAQDVIGHSTKKCATCGKPVASCTYKGNHPVEKCKTCGKALSSCPYKGNHPVEKCKTCGKALSSCQYKGNHPVARCSECGKTISSCPYSGRHPKKASYISVNGYSTYNVSAASSGQTVSISVSTDGDNWTTWGVPSWCYITNKTSSGFTLNVQANNGSSSRSDYMTVNSDGKSARINITQKASSSSSSTVLKTVSSPSFSSRSSTALSIDKVEITSSNTILTMTYTASASGTMYINPKAYITANGSQYKLQSATGIALPPNKTSYSANQKITFKLYFPAIPTSTSTIDFTEPSENDGSSPWRISGIRLSSSSSSSSSAKPTAQIKSVTVDHNQMRDGKKSMVIHVKFDIQNAKGHSCDVLAYFYYANGNKLMDTNGHYKTSDGQCCASEDCKPGYDRTTYSDFEVVMPNSEIESSGSGVELKFKVKIYDYETKQFVEEEAKWVEFTK